MTSIERITPASRDGIEIIPVSNRGDWLSLRHRDVTATDVPALFGKHPYKTGLQVFADKTGNGFDKGDNSAMRDGRILEPGVAVAVGEERPHWDISPAKIYVRDSVARIGATPDFLVRCPERGDGILEAKTADQKVFDEQWQSGPPLAWILQCLTQMMLMGREWGAIAVLIRTRGFPLYIYDVPRNAAVEKAIRDKVSAFWGMVERGEAPPPDFTRDGDAISAMFPREEAGKAVDLSQDNRLPELLAERADLSAVIKQSEARKDEIDAEVKAKLEDAELGTLPGWKITWKSQTRKETIIPAKTIRILRVTDLREKEIA